MITVTAACHPLRADRVQFDIEPGSTVEDAIVEAATRGGVPLASMANAVAVVGDYIVPKDRWKHTRPKSGPVIVKAQPAGPVLPLIVSVAGWAASSGIVSALGLTGLAVGLTTAGITWTSPLHTSMTP